MYAILLKFFVSSYIIGGDINRKKMKHMDHIPAHIKGKELLKALQALQYNFASSATTGLLISEKETNLIDFFITKT